MPSIMIWPPPRLTRPTRDSPLVTNAPLLVSSVARLDDSRSDAPSAGAALASDSDRDGVALCGATAGGTAGNGTLTVGVAGRPPTVTVGVVTVGVVTVAAGVVTVTAGVVTVGGGGGVFTSPVG